MTYPCSFRVRHASLQIDFLHSTLQNRSTWTVIIFPRWQVNFQMNRVSATGVPPYWQPPSTPFNFTHLWPQTISLLPLDHSLQYHISIASKFISELTGSQSQSVSPNSLQHSLPVHLQTRLITTANSSWLWPPSAFRNLLNFNIPVHTTRASKCIFNLAQLWSPHVQLGVQLNQHVQAHIQCLSSTAGCEFQYIPCVDE
jgi:hypothetical protein